MKNFSLEDIIWIKNNADKFINIGVLIIDSNNNITYVNDYFSYLFELKKEYLLNKNINVLKCIFQNIEQYEDLLSKLSVSNIINLNVKSITHNNDSNLYFNMSFYAIKSSHKMEGFIAFLLDNTYYKRIENKYKTLLNSLSDTYILLLDKNYNIIEFYPNLAKEIYELILSTNNYKIINNNKLNTIKNNRELKLNYEYLITNKNEFRIFNVVYNSFNYDKYILVITELTDKKTAILQKIYINNIEKLKESLI